MGIGQQAYGAVRARVPRDWRGTIADGVERFGERTGGVRVLPSFLIVGGQRCGTNSMYEYLVAHHAVMRAMPHQEVHYFDLHHDRGLRWYRGHFPTRGWVAATGARAGHPALTGESSPYYMFHPLAPARIASTLPDVRLLILLRDPVDRAYSQFHHERAHGNESLSFDEALEREPMRLAGEEDRIRSQPGYASFSHQHYSYLARGRYADQLEVLFAALPPEQVHVVVSEHLFAEPQRVESEVLNFLGLPSGSDRPHGRHNAGRYDEMPAALRRRLADHFAESNHRLTEMIGEDLPWS